METVVQSHYREALKRAGHLAQAADHHGALAAYDEAIELAPCRAAAHYEMGLLHHKLGQVTEAIACFERAAELVPEDATVWNNLGVLYYGRKELAQAERAFRQALSLDERYGDAWYGLARVLLQQSREVEASHALRNCLQWEPWHGKARQELSGLETGSASIATGGGHLKTKGCFAERSWCRENRRIIRYLLGFEELRIKMHGTRFWEYPFAFKEVMKRPKSRIVDIGIGRGAFASVLVKNGHQVVGVDNYGSCWSVTRDQREKEGIDYIDADARNLAIQDGQFDLALLISMIEHVPSNTIFCEKRRTVKTAEMLRAEVPEKRKVIAEALRVVKPGGVVIITSDIYLDYPPGMNISWREMLGLGGIDVTDIGDASDLYISDNPIHKGRILPVGLVLEKSG